MTEKLLAKPTSKQVKKTDREFLKEFRFYSSIGRKPIPVDSIILNHRLGIPKY